MDHKGGAPGQGLGEDRRLRRAEVDESTGRKKPGFSSDIMSGERGPDQIPAMLDVIMGQTPVS